MSLAAKLILLLLVFAAGAAGGIKWEIGVVAARDLRIVQENARVAILRSDKVDKAAERHEATKAQIEYVYSPITKEVERVVSKIEYRDRACLDDDGVRVLGRALAATNAAAGFPARAVSGAAGTD